MKIRSIETIPYSLPRRREHSWRGNRVPIGTYLLVRVFTDDGRVGIGEAPTLIDWGGGGGRYYGESPETAASVISGHLAPALVGVDPVNLNAAHQAMDRVVAGHPYAKAAIDVACYDLAGQVAGMPVSALLGGAIHQEIPVAHSFGLGMTPDEIEAEACAVLAEGIRHFKLKVGADLSRDVAVVARLRRIAPDASICVDANQAWADAAAAIDAVGRLDEHHLAWVEQPVERTNALREVRRRVRPPIMADESVWTAGDVHELVAEAAVDYVSIYYTKPGGLRPALDVATACASLGVLANVNGSAESGVGSAANLHLAAAAAAVQLPSLIMASAPSGAESTRVGARLYMDDLIAEPLPFHDGMISVPQEPGLGVRVNEAKVAQYRLDR